jgi:uracil-DNA glycosylase
VPQPSRPGATPCPAPGPVPAEEAERFRRIFRRAHADHAACLADEWLEAPCAGVEGAEPPRPLVWSRRNGPWRRVPVLFVGAAPGNDHGRGSGGLGAHATRIPFGGDVAGANLDVLLESIGIDRNATFLVAALNRLPAAGGGEPTAAELLQPVGGLRSSLHLLRETVVAAGPALVVALGNVALRSVVAAARLETDARLPALARLAKAGVARGAAVAWPDILGWDAAMRAAWEEAWSGAAVPRLLQLYHPSAQNMSPHAAADTAFHARMVETRASLRAAMRSIFGVSAGGCAERAGGIYALADWRDRVAPRHEPLLALWRSRLAPAR